MTTDEKTELARFRRALQDIASIPVSRGSMTEFYDVMININSIARGALEGQSEPVWHWAREENEEISGLTKLAKEIFDDRCKVVSINNDLRVAVMELLPIAEGCYQFHQRNGSHPDFLSSIIQILLNAKTLITTKSGS